MAVGLHHLRYFVAVAEEGHVSRAAARLRISQPSLSAQIQYLEKQVGVLLVHRHSRGVTLTPSGEAFLHHARTALTAAAEAVDAARLAENSQAGNLKIGFIVGTHVEITSSILSLFQECHPEVTVEFTEHSFTDPSAGLNSGEVDVAFTVLPFQHVGLEFLPLQQNSRMAMVPRNHPLAGRESVSVKELFDDPWAVTDTEDAVCRDFWLAMEHRSGPPKLSQRMRSLDKFVQLVMSGNTVGLVSQWVSVVYARVGVVFIPVTDVAPVVTVLAWHGDRVNGFTRQFIATAQQAVLKGQCS